MKSKHTLVFSGLILASTMVLAGGFDGPFIQLGIGGNESESVIGRTSGAEHHGHHDRRSNLATQSDSQSTTVGQIAAGYSKSFGKFNLAGSIFYVIGDQKAGHTVFHEQQERHETRSSNIKTENSDTWGLSIEPGWNFTEKALVYAKFSYTETTGSFEVNESVNRNRRGCRGDSLSHSGNSTYRGWAYGMGAKYKVTENIYGVAEVMQSEFGDRSFETGSGKERVKYDMDRSSLSAFIGIGYKF